MNKVEHWFQRILEAADAWVDAELRAADVWIDAEFQRDWHHHKIKSVDFQIQ